MKEGLNYQTGFTRRIKKTLFEQNIIKNTSHGFISLKNGNILHLMLWDILFFQQQHNSRGHRKGII